MVDDTSANRAPTELQGPLMKRHMAAISAGCVTWQPRADPL
jgi:hypothetical protein